MGNENSMASQSSWFRQYEQEVNGARNASNGNKKILIIIPILLIGGMIALMIRNGALESEQTRGGVYALGGIGIFLVLIILILLGKSKKKDAAAITRKDLDALLTSPELAEEFDLQMKEKPLFQVQNQKDDYVFATKDYLGICFKYLGDVTYRFVRRSDVSVLHSYKNSAGCFDVEFQNPTRKVLMCWVAKDKKTVEELKASLVNADQNISSSEG